MFVTSLQHFLVRAADLRKSADFYARVLGLEDGWRPPLPFPGHWMYAGGIPIVHLCGTETSDGQNYFIGDRPAGAFGSGALDHVGMSAKDRYAFVRHLEALGVPCILRTAPGGAVLQVFVDDPDGLRIEMNYETDYERELERGRGRPFALESA